MRTSTNSGSHQHQKSSQITMSTLLELLERDKFKWLDLVAVVYDDGNAKQIQTYKQMFAFAEKVSEALREELGSNSVIAVCRNTNLFTPAILCGILGCGSAFYSFDKHAVERTAGMFQLMGVSAALVQDDYTQVLESLILLCGGEVATNSFLSSLGLTLLKIPERNEMHMKESIQDIAYYITTSGSTGQPKLVQVPHRCIIPNITHIRSIYNLRSSDVVLLCSPLTFDPSIVEIFTTLTSGAGLLIVPDHIKPKTRELLPIIYRRNRVTVIQATPSSIQRIPSSDLRNTILSESSSLRILAFGGEKFPSLNKIREWRAPNNKTRFINLFGITEVSCWSFYHCLSDKEFWYSGEEVPLGVPLSQSSYKIVNEDGEEVLQGEGMLYLGGYARQCMIDEEILVFKSEKLQNFRDSGDVVRIDSEGRIFYVGRHDRQVKRNGCRLNLEEIEKIMLSESRVSDCKAVMDDGRLVMDDGRLVVFVIPNQDLEIDYIVEYLQSIIERKLPRHYVPDNIVPVQDFPITKHGKCDFHALMTQYLKSLNKYDLQSSVTIENFIREKWKKLLRSGEVTNKSNFLLSGGDSFSAVTLARIIEDQFKISAPDLVDIILHKSFADIINCIEKHKNSSLLKRARENRENLIEKGVSSVTKKKMKILKEPINRLMKPCSCINSAVTRGNQFFCLVCMTTASKFNSGTYIPKPTGTERRNVELQQKWNFDTGKCVDASPLVIKASPGFHVVYIGSHSHNMFALVVETGELLWKTELGDRIESSACVSACGKYIVVGCYDGGVYMLSRDTGEICWVYKTQSAVKSSPIIDPITRWIIIGSHDHHLYALNVEDQTCCWSVDVGRGSVFSSPAVSTDPHYVCSCSLSGCIAAIHPTNGKIIWVYNSKKPVFSSPVITNTGPCVGCVDGNLFQLDHHGNLVWVFSTSAPIFSSPLIIPLFQEDSPDSTEISILVGSHDRCVYCVASNGRLLWKHHTADVVYSTCFCFDNTCTWISDNNKHLDRGNSKLKHSNNMENQTTEITESNHEVTESSHLITEINHAVIEFNPTVTETNPKVTEFNHAVTKSNPTITEVNPAITESNQPDIVNQRNNAKPNMLYKYCVVASKDGGIAILDTSDGHKVHSVQLPMEVFSSPVISENYLLVGCRDNNVYCFSIEK